MRQRLLRCAALGLLILLPAACAETPTAPQGPTTAAEPGKARGYYKVGSPYKISGMWYYPAEDYDYSEAGVASWYGEQFHARETANGEVFDLNDLTAAHRTLPMPSMVRVTNLGNGRVLALRVNDRGPFANDRILDVSRRAAQLLGFERQGTTRVKVEILAEESMALKSQLLRNVQVAGMPKTQAAPKVDVAAETLPPLPGGTPGSSGSSSQPPHSQPPPSPPRAPPRAVSPQPYASSGNDVQSSSVDDVQSAALPPPSPAFERASASVPPPYQPAASRSDNSVQARPAAVDRPATTGGARDGKTANAAGYFIQVASFSNEDNARRASTKLRDLGPTIVSPQRVGDRSVYRVRMGPFGGAGEAGRLLPRIRKAGYDDARVVKGN